jgi:peptidoglycan/LPS O-acetylase OafA/YrhL
VLLSIPKSDLSVVLVVPLLVIALTSDSNVLGRIFAWAPAESLGKLSFSIYLVHKLLFGLENGIYVRSHAAGLLTAYRTIEVPGRRWLRTLFEQNTFIVQASLSHVKSAGAS